MRVFSLLFQLHKLFEMMLHVYVLHVHTHTHTHIKFQMSQVTTIWQCAVSTFVLESCCCRTTNFQNSFVNRRHFSSCSNKLFWILFLFRYGNRRHSRNSFNTSEFFFFFFFAVYSDPIQNKCVVYSTMICSPRPCWWMVVGWLAFTGHTKGRSLFYCSTISTCLYNCEKQVGAGNIRGNVKRKRERRAEKPCVNIELLSLAALNGGALRSAPLQDCFFLSVFYFLYQDPRCACLPSSYSLVCFQRSTSAQQPHCRSPPPPSSSCRCCCCGFASTSPQQPSRKPPST